MKSALMLNKENQKAGIEEVKKAFGDDGLHNHETLDRKSTRFNHSR